MTLSCTRRQWLETDCNSGAEFDAFIKAGQARWTPVMARAQIKPAGA